MSPPIPPEWVHEPGALHRHLKLPNGRLACGIVAVTAKPAQTGLKCVSCKLAEDRLKTHSGRLLYQVLGNPLASDDALAIAEAWMQASSLLRIDLDAAIRRIDALYTPPSPPPA